MKLIGREELIDHPDYATPAVRLSRLEDSFGIVEAWTQTKTKREVMDAFNSLNVPCGPIMSTKDLVGDEHVKLREMMVELDHPERGRWYNVGCPIKLSDSPVEVDRSPLLGEHTDEVLSEVLGYGADEVAQLRRAGAFTREPPVG